MHEADGGRLQLLPLLGARRAGRAARGDPQYGIVSTAGESGNVQRIKAPSSRSRSPEKAPIDAGGGRPLRADAAHLPSSARTCSPGAGGEIQLTDGIASLLQEEPVLAYQFKGTRYDCGSKLGYLQATIALGAQTSRGGQGIHRLPGDSKAAERRVGCAVRTDSTASSGAPALTPGLSAGAGLGLSDCAPCGPGTPCAQPSFVRRGRPAAAPALT